MDIQDIDLSEVLYEIKFESVLSAIRRRGHKATELSVEDLELAKAEMKAAIDHYERDILDILNIGIDSWEIAKNL